jgi:hypothetical protein
MYRRWDLNDAVARPSIASSGLYDCPPGAVEEVLLRKHNFLE